MILNYYGLSYPRALGTLYGVACGDALGAPVEFWPRSAILRAYPRGKGLSARMDGDCTDDTGLTLALARGLLQGGSDRLEECAGGEFIRWLYTSGRGVGLTCSTTISAAARMLLSSDQPPAEVWGAAAQYAEQRTGMPSEGNGGLMRCAFVGLYARSVQEAEELAVRQARMTHRGEDNLAACAWYAGTIWAVSRAKHRRRAWNRRLRVLPPQFSPLPAVADPDGTAASTLRAVVYVVNTSRHFYDALQSAVLLGGDTDTVAALVGGLAGAMCGAGAVPLAWLNRLSDPVRCEIRAVGEALFGY